MSINKASQKIPKLRFKGFTDGWEERKLGEISKTTIGEFVIKTKQSDESPYPVYNGGRSYTGKYDEYNNDGPKIVISARGANAGFVNYVSGRYWAGNSCYSVSVTKEDEFSIGYLYQFIKYNQVLFTAYQQAANIPSVSKSDVEKFSIKYPTVLEQKKIESFFKQLDNTIALHQRKLDQLNQLKEALLQQMFPGKGETVPKLRFAGFEGDWEEWKLGEYTNYRRGSFPQPYGNKEWYGGENAMPFVQVVDVSNNLKLEPKTKQNISSIAQPKSVFVSSGTVVVTLQGSIGRVAITQYDSYVDRTLLIFEDYVRKTDKYFWGYTIQNKFNIEKEKAPGGTIKTITKAALSQFVVSIPLYSEQDKLGTFLKNIDTTITLQQRKLDQLKNMKQVLLQNMFI